MRLIDADKLKEMYLELANDEEVGNVRKLECLRAMSEIDEQPTAYVVKRLRAGRIYTRHEVACLIAEVVGDVCACNVNGIDEWLPDKCDFTECGCPNVYGVACWEQYLEHKEE